MATSDSLTFIGEWFRKETDTVQQLFVVFYPREAAIEMYDRQTKKVFLQKTKIEDLTEKDFFVGAKILIFGKQINILDYGDAGTKEKYGSEQRTFVMVFAESFPHIGEILQAINKNDLTVRQLKMLKIDENYSWVLKNFRSEQSELCHFVDNIPSQSFVAMELTGNNSYTRFRQLCGPNTSDGPGSHARTSLRALYGTGIYYPSSADASNLESQFVFSHNEPHAVRNGRTGEILSQILKKGFIISAMKMFRFERPNCEEFLSVYKGVVPEYESMVMQMISGDCLALEITSKFENGPDTQRSFRDFCGPSCPETARVTRPHTLRAQFGQDKILNAIYCTDLEEDIQLELEYVFKFLP